MLTQLGVACDVVAPSLIPVRAGDRVKTDRRDAKKLVRLYRAGELSYVAPPTPETEGLRDLMRCREDLRRARTAARHRVSKQLLRHGRIYRDGRSQWTRRHRAWIARQRLDDPLAQDALGQMLVHLDGLDRQLDALDRDLEQIARGERWAVTVEILTRFRGVSTHRARADRRDRRLRPLLAPARACRLAGDRALRVLLRRPASSRPHHQDRQRPRPPPADRGRLGLPPRTPPARPRPQPDARAWQAQVRLHRRYRHLTEHGKRSTVATVAVARELAGFLWAATTDQPLVPGAGA